jgi:hypothetical protein
LAPEASLGLGWLQISSALKEESVTAQNTGGPRFSVGLSARFMLAPTWELVAGGAVETAPFAHAPSFVFTQEKLILEGEPVRSARLSFGIQRSF